MLYDVGYCRSVYTAVPRSTITVLAGRFSL